MPLRRNSSCSLCFHAFGDHLEVEALAHVDDGAEYAASSESTATRGEEKSSPSSFSRCQRADRKLLQRRRESTRCRNRRWPVSTHGVQLFRSPYGAFRVRSSTCFRDLPARNMWVRPHACGNPARQRSMKLACLSAERQFDRDSARSATGAFCHPRDPNPPVQIPTRLCQYQAGSLREGNEVARGNMSPVAAEAPGRALRRRLAAAS